MNESKLHHTIKDAVRIRRVYRMNLGHLANGGVNAVKKIELTQGNYAMVDKDDYDKINQFNWHYALGYARRNIRLDSGERRTEFMHRVIANTPDDKYTDHINGNTLDNRKMNLRHVEQYQNARNARKRNDAASNYKGVNRHKRKQDLIGKWKAGIQVDKKRVFLGYYESEIEAALAYNEAAKKYFKEYAVLNEVEFMNMYEYQKKASRTVPSEKWFNTKIANFSMGLVGEAGEVIDHLKKVIYHNHELDREEIEKELGDVLWYLTALATTMNMDLNEIAKKNIDKLKARYPNGFSEEDSKNRVI